eukprot:361747-Chlamydomonas_euryale.AAC.4
MLQSERAPARLGGRGQPCSRQRAAAAPSNAQSRHVGIHPPHALWTDGTPTSRATRAGAAEPRAAERLQRVVERSSVVALAASRGSWPVQKAFRRPLLPPRTVGPAEPTVPL